MSKKKKKTCIDCVHAGKIFGPYVFCKLMHENHDYETPCDLYEVKVVKKPDSEKK